MLPGSSLPGREAGVGHRNSELSSDPRAGHMLQPYGHTERRGTHTTGCGMIRCAGLPARVKIVFAV